MAACTSTENTNRFSEYSSSLTKSSQGCSTQLKQQEIHEFTYFIDSADSFNRPTAKAALGPRVVPKCAIGCTRDVVELLSMFHIRISHAVANHGFIDSADSFNRPTAKASLGPLMVPKCAIGYMWEVAELLSMFHIKISHTVVQSRLLHIGNYTHGVYTAQLEHQGLHEFI
jgi:hypothetical protein